MSALSLLRTVGIIRQRGEMNETSTVVVACNGFGRNLFRSYLYSSGRFHRGSFRLPCPGRRAFQSSTVSGSQPRILPVMASQGGSL